MKEMITFMKKNEKATRTVGAGLRRLKTRRETFGSPFADIEMKQHFIQQ